MKRKVTSRVDGQYLIYVLVMIKTDLFNIYIIDFLFYVNFFNLLIEKNQIKREVTSPERGMRA